jgi:hypothetical protein
MCAKSHIKYRDARKGLSASSDFPQKKGHFGRIMAQKAGKKV